MPEIKSLGQIAYEGYINGAQGKDWLTNAPLPHWGAPSVNQKAWEAAGAAVMQLTTVPQEPPKPAEAKQPPEPQTLHPQLVRPEPKAVTQTLPAKPVPTPVKSVPSPPSPSKGRGSS